MDRRTSNQGTLEPAVQVVGFHVEGRSPSPVPPSVLAESCRKITAGSPTPVIIPPSFQRDPTHTPGVSRPLDFSTPNKGAAALSKAFSGVATPSTEGSTAGETSVTKLAPRRSLDDLTPSQPPPVAPPIAQSVPSRISAGPLVTRVILEESVAPAGVSESTASVASSTPGTPSARSSKTVESSSTVAPVSQGPTPPTGVKEKPKLTRAERRAIQEKQREAKAQAKAAANEQEGGQKVKSGDGGKPPKTPKSTAAPERSVGAPPVPSQDGVSSQATPTHSHPPSRGSSLLKKEKKDRPGVSLHSMELFSHLQQYKRLTVQEVLRYGATSPVHPAILKLGLQYSNGTIKGGNARCVALLEALSQVVRDYHTPEGRSLSRDLISHVNNQITFLVECRPLSVSMGNAIKHLKVKINKIDPSMPEEAAKKELVDSIYNYVQEKVIYADKGLVGYAVSKVYDGDVILTYAFSHAILAILLEAKKRNTRFRVVVVDSRPELEGKQLLKRLIEAGINCSYILINGLSYIIPEVKKVFLGASAVLSNGTVMSRAGSAAVAMVAAAKNIPVLICCETCKFHERVQLDSITHNELGDPSALATVPGNPAVQHLQGWEEQPRLGLLNLKYDAMPAEFVTMIVTEVGMIPPTSVPVILREYRQES